MSGGTVACNNPRIGEGQGPDSGPRNMRPSWPTWAKTQVPKWPTWANIQNAAPEPEAIPVANPAPKKDTEQEQEMLTLKEELVAQEALREKEIKGTKENNRRGETNNGRESSKESSQ